MAISVTTALANIIVMNEFCVYGSLKPASQACLGMDVDVTLFGANFQFSGNYLRTYYQ